MAMTVVWRFGSAAPLALRNQEVYNRRMVVSRADIRRKMDELLGDVQRDIDISLKRRIFCNRSLRLANIKFIGFDMDYTLALYNQERLEQLSMQLTLDKMIANHGYPEEIRELQYDSRYAIRGVVIDKNLGNVFKMDRHGHVGRVYHGFNLLAEEERERAYRTTRIRLSSPRYVWIDTLFGLPEAVMYITLVAYYDGRGEKVDYKKLFEDIRASIDEAHRDDTLKTVIKEHLSEYVSKDPKLAETMHKLRSSGKKLFVLTNSYWPYSNEVMKYLLDDVRPAYPSWRNYFDFVIVGGQKPGWFSERKPFIEIDPETGAERDREVTALSRGMVVQGGNIVDFERMAGAAGDGVLYVGDHIYGDVIKVKKSHLWRTAMVLQELEQENTTSERLASQLADLVAFDRRLRNLQSEIDYQALKLKQLKQLTRLRDDAADDGLKEEIEGARKEAKSDLDQIRERWVRTEKEVEALEQSIDRAYNPYWGAMFRERHENSRFGQQVAVYADLYTSRVSNFLSYSPLRYFRAPRMRMPHE